MAEQILLRISGPQADSALAELQDWLENSAGISLQTAPGTTGGFDDSKGDGARNRLLRFERVLSAAGSIASLVGLLSLWQPSDPPPPPISDPVRYARLVDGARQFLDKLNGMHCDKDFVVELIQSQGGASLKITAKTAPADLIAHCQATRNRQIPNG